MFPIGLVMGVLSIIASAALAATVPTQINHQGVVSVNGQRFNGNGSFYFAIVDPTTSNSVWTNDGTNLGTAKRPDQPVAIACVNGLYTVRLGDTALTNMTPVTVDVFSTDNRGLRIWFDDGTNGVFQLTPDHPLTSSAYADRVGFVDNPELTDTIEAGSATGDIGSLNVFGAAGLTSFVVRSDTGNVGVGTANPEATLEVAKDFGVGGRAVRITNTNPTTNNEWSLVTVQGGSERVRIGPDRLEVVRGAPEECTLCATSYGLVYTDGTVGIGTHNPNARLEIVGSSSDTDADTLRLTNAAERPILVASNYGRVGIGSSPGTPDFSLQSQRGFMIQADTSPELNLVGSETQGNAGTGSIIFHNTNSTEPKKRVASIVASVSGPSGAHLDFNTEDGSFANASPRMRITSEGDVGIGTTSPALSANLAGARFLTVNGGRSGGNADEALAVLEMNGLNTIDTVSDTSQIRFLNNGVSLASISGGMAGAPNLGFVRFVVPNANATDSVEAMRITTPGYVGIGTANPTEKLTVCGDIRASGSITANAGCDVAEAFELSDPAEVQPGMVMVLDANKPGSLRVSDKAYDTKVAGIVSGANGLGPGVMLGGSEERYAGGLPIALSGRVYCLVDATKHGVSIGDLLTTSGTPGHAMKVTNFRRSQGAVLGKAMEPMEKGQQGLVLVLVGLQ